MIKVLKMEKYNKSNKFKDFNKQNNKRSFDKKDNFRKPERNNRSFEKKSEERNDSDSLYLKGRHEVVQALESGQSLNSVYISAAVRGGIAAQIKELASKASVPVKELSPDIFEKKFGEKTQGVAAEAAAFEYSELDELIERAEEGHQVLVALNQVEDARNLGAIVRTVEAMGCDGVIIPKYRSAGMTEWAVRTAQGAAAWLPVARVNNLCEALEDLKKAGYWVTGLDGSADKQLKDVKYDSKVVLVAGGEDVGLGDRVKKTCDDIVKIPMAGRTPSLNVSVSVGMAIYEILSQKNFFEK